MALILIVDDSSTTRSAVRKLVKEDGHETLEADYGQKGLGIIQNVCNQPDNDGTQA